MLWGEVGGLATIKSIKVIYSTEDYGTVYYWLPRFGNLGSLSDFLMVRSVMGPGKDQVTVEAYVVSSSGPFLGFAGYWVDVDTGFLLASDVKRSEYVPFFNLYAYLRSKGLTFSSKSFYKWLVGTKLGVLEYDDFPGNLQDFSESSVTSILLQSRFEADSGGPSFTLEELMEDFVAIFDHFGRGPGSLDVAGGVSPDVAYSGKFSPLGQDKSGYAYDLVADFERQQEGASLLPLSLKELGDRSQFIELNYKNRPPISKKDLFMAMCAVACGGRAMLPKSKSEYLAMNFYDVSDSLDRSNLVDDALDNPDEVANVVEKVGLDVYLTGRRKSSVITGLRDSRFQEKFFSLGLSRYTSRSYLRNMASGRIPVSYQLSFDVSLFRRALNRVLAVVS